MKAQVCFPLPGWVENNKWMMLTRAATQAVECDGWRFHRRRENVEGEIRREND